MSVLLWMPADATFPWLHGCSNSQTPNSCFDPAPALLRTCSTATSRIFKAKLACSDDPSDVTPVFSGHPLHALVCARCWTSLLPCSSSTTRTRRKKRSNSLLARVHDCSCFAHLCVESCRVNFAVPQSRASKRLCIADFEPVTPLTIFEGSKGTGPQSSRCEAPMQ